MKHLILFFKLLYAPIFVLYLVIVFLLRAWTTPRTWTAGEIVSAALLNTHIRDNLNYLFNGRWIAQAHWTGSANYSISSTSFVDVDATNLIISGSILSGRAEIMVSLLYTPDPTNDCAFDIIVDSTTRAGPGSFGSFRGAGAGAGKSAAFRVIVTGLSAGTHTFKLQARTVAGTLSILNNGFPIVMTGKEI